MELPTYSIKVLNVRVLMLPPVLSTPRALDMLNVMTYDFHGSWDTMTGECSPLFKGPEDHDSFIYFNVVSTWTSSQRKFTKNWAYVSKESTQNTFSSSRAMYI